MPTPETEGGGAKTQSSSIYLKQRIGTSSRRQGKEERRPSFHTFGPTYCAPCTASRCATFGPKVASVRRIHMAAPTRSGRRGSFGCNFGWAMYATQLKVLSRVTPLHRNQIQLQMRIWVLGAKCVHFRSFSFCTSFITVWRRGLVRGKGDSREAGKSLHFCECHM